MFVISTRNFPPDVGGIQNLMEGLAKALVSHGPVKIFADIFPESEKYDKNSNLEIERNLEQMRAMENNLLIKVGLSEYSPLGVDTQKDLKRVIERMK